jgi:hypothetical protein
LKFQQQIRELYPLFKEENSKRVETACKQVFEEASEFYQTSIAVDLPMSTSSLVKLHEEAEQRSMDLFTRKLDEFAKSGHFTYYKKLLSSQIEGFHAKQTVRNMELMGALLFPLSLFFVWPTNEQLLCSFCSRLFFFGCRKQIARCC